MENSTDPEYIKRQYEELKKRNRINGVGGILQSEGTNSSTNMPEDIDKVFEERKNSMTYKNGVASLGIKNKSIPNSRKRNNSISNGIRIFTVGENKSKK